MVPPKAPGGPASGPLAFVGAHGGGVKAVAASGDGNVIASAMGESSTKLGISRVWTTHMATAPPGIPTFSGFEEGMLAISLCFARVSESHNQKKDNAGHDVGSSALH
jgi:hypothetical protein